MEVIFNYLKEVLKLSLPTLSLVMIILISLRLNYLKNSKEKITIYREIFLFKRNL